MQRSLLVLVTLMLTSCPAALRAGNPPETAPATESAVAAPDKPATRPATQPTTRPTAVARRLLITGFFGGQIWSVNPHDTTPLARTDFSGLTLSEFRLGAGFINCDPAAWAGRQIEDVVRISRSEEMRPWVGDVSPPAYRRPIPRRIAEEAGVPRESFGRRKQPGVAVLLQLFHVLLVIAQGL